MDINAFIKHIKDTLAQKVKEVPIITNTARQAGNLAPVTPILGRALMTDLQPTIEKYTSPATYDFLNTLLGPLGASKYAPQEQQYFKDLPTGQLSPESKLAGKSLGEQDLISMMGLTRSPTAISTNTLKAVEIQKSIDMMNNKYLTAKGTDKVQLRKAIMEAQQMQEAFTARPTADDLKFDSRAQTKLTEKPTQPSPTGVPSANELANKAGVSSEARIQKIPLSKISGTDYPELDAALKSGKRLTVQEANDLVGRLEDPVVAGRKITTPISVTLNSDGTYSLQGGNNRIAQALVNGDKTINAASNDFRTGISFQDYAKSLSSPTGLGGEIGWGELRKVLLHRKNYKEQ
jgi:hypothetical protein